MRSFFTRALLLGLVACVNCHVTLVTSYPDYKLSRASGVRWSNQHIGTGRRLCALVSCFCHFKYKYSHFFFVNHSKAKRLKNQITLFTLIRVLCSCAFNLIIVVFIFCNTFLSLPVELCQPPKAPNFGDVDCVDGDQIENASLIYSNETDANGTYFTNSTLDGLTCTFYCDAGYFLPYRTLSVFTCDEEGIWSSEEFPSSCISMSDITFAYLTGL